jgi:signal transduction histidine kinase
MATSGTRVDERGDDLAERIGELSSLSSFLQRNGEREKATLARELHDELGGILTSLKMDLALLRSRVGDEPRYAERFARLDALVDQAIDLKRRVIENLRPSLLDHLGLAAALEWYVDEESRKAGIEPHLAVDRGLERLPPDLEIACFRLVQEAVTNVVKHARATHLDLTVERAAAGLRITVSDDGVGIADMVSAQRSHGIAGMSHRMHTLGGTLKVLGIAGGGTRLEVFIPLESATKGLESADKRR